MPFDGQQHETNHEPSLSLRGDLVLRGDLRLHGDPSGDALDPADDCSELPDDLVELAAQLCDDARYLGQRYPAESPGLWWDRSQEAEATFAVTAKPGLPAQPGLPARVAWYRKPIVATAAVVLLVVAGGWLLSQQDHERPENPGANRGNLGPLAPQGPGNVLAMPRAAVATDVTPASWTPEVYPDVSGEEEQVLHDELKLIRAAEL